MLTGIEFEASARFSPVWTPDAAAAPSWGPSAMERYRGAVRNNPAQARAAAERDFAAALRLRWGDYELCNDHQDRLRFLHALSREPRAHYGVPLTWRDAERIADMVRAEFAARQDAAS